MRYFGFTGMIISAAAFVLLIQCSQDRSQNKSPNPATIEESLIKANQEALRVENEQIDDFIRRHKLEMKTTATGLRYMISKNGIGPKVEPMRTVKLAYTISLLSGDTVYSAMKDGPLIFQVGKGQVITGLEEAILLLRVGDRAKFIIPSHLAFGLIGDQKKIHQKASLVYDLELISMQ